MTQSKAAAVVVELPMGFELVTTYVRYPKKGEYFLTPDFCVALAEKDYTSYKYPILRRVDRHGNVPTNSAGEPIEMTEEVPKTYEVTTAQNLTWRTYRPGTSKKAIVSRLTAPERPQSYNVVRWPEFLALAKRLGINLELPFRDLVIELRWDDLVHIHQSYLADNIDQPNAKTPFDPKEPKNAKANDQGSATADGPTTP